MFSHMAVMYAYALYQRNYAHQAYAVLDLIYRQTTNFAVSRMYPGIPEYFDAKGRGVYPYLTGSASWYLLTMLTQAFGIRGQTGHLLISPQLVRAQFDVHGQASVRTQFAGRQLLVTYHNPKKLDYGEYRLDHILLTDHQPVVEITDEACRIQKRTFTELMSGVIHKIDVWLTAK